MSKYATQEILKPQQPLHNRQVIEIYTPHVQIDGVQCKRREEIKLLQTKYKDFVQENDKGKFIKVKNYKFKPDEWNMDGQIFYKQPFKNPEDTQDEFYVEIKQMSDLGINKAGKATMKKNQEKRKKLEEEDIRNGYARPKIPYSGFSDDEEEKIDNKQEKNLEVQEQTTKLGDPPIQEEEKQDGEEEGEEVESVEEQPKEIEIKKEIINEKSQNNSKNIKNKSLSQKSQEKIMDTSIKSRNSQISKTISKISKADEEEQEEDILQEEKSQNVLQDEEDVDPLLELSRLSKSMASNKSKRPYRSQAANLMGELLGEIDTSTTSKRKK